MVRKHTSKLKTKNHFIDIHFFKKIKEKIKKSKYRKKRKQHTHNYVDCNPENLSMNTFLV